MRHSQSDVVGATLATFAQHQPDLVFMDISMPRLDGLEATRQIKATAAGVRTPVVILTAHAFEEDRVQATQAGADSFLTKPCKTHQLYALLGRFFKHRKSAPPMNIVEVKMPPR